MPKLVWLNGEVSPIESAVTSVADHAHLYGDGLFEGIRFYDRKIFQLDPHLDRLFHGARYMGYDVRMDQAALRALVIEMCQKADLPEGYIRINLTRGTGLGLDPKNITSGANIMVMISSLNLYPDSMYEMGISVKTSPFRVMPAEALDPKLKCIGRYASNILAKQYANKTGADEGLMLNHQGYVAEGTGNNIFLVKNGHVRTPHPSCGLLVGITRNVVMEMAKEAGHPVTEDFLTAYDFGAADEAFFTGTATEIMPMIAIDNQKIGCGKPGPVTVDLMRRFREAIKLGVPF